jgi:hypothetical protein
MSREACSRKGQSDTGGDRVGVSVGVEVAPLEEEEEEEESSSPEEESSTVDPPQRGA